jgi:hypothetical protein
VKYCEIGTWSMEAETQPRIGVCTSCEVFLKTWIAEAVCQIDLINRIPIASGYVIRMPGGVEGGES